MGDLPIKHVVSVSGGKDSTACILLALALYPRHMLIFIFADTGHEHPLTYEYLDYLEAELGITIERLRADFTPQLAGKRKFVLEKWPEMGVSPEIVAAAAEVLQPTGIPFLDLCTWKGRFPSRRAQFCTEELKTNLLVERQLDFAEAGFWVWSWQGVRADESRNRRYLPEWEDLGGHIGIYRPILRWPAVACFEAMAYRGIAPNPLYKQGMNRVGCMPCINTSKDELAEIARRWPWVIDKLEKWERLVMLASKCRGASFFPAPNDGRGALRGDNIREYVEWAKTSFGGRQYDLLKAGEALACSSSYGLCE